MKRLALLTLFAMMFCSMGAFAQDDYVIPRGVSIIVRLGNTLDTRQTKKGEVVTFTTAQLIFLSETVALPQGLKIHAEVERVNRPGRISGRAFMQIRPTTMQLNENTSVPLVLGGVKPVEKALGDTYYRGLGDRKLASPQGSVRFSGLSTTAEDFHEMVRNPLSVAIGWVPTILERGQDLVIDQGFPVIMTLGADLKIPKGSIEVIEIVPMCPCQDQKKAPEKKREGGTIV